MRRGEAEPPRYPSGLERFHAFDPALVERVQMCRGWAARAKAARNAAAVASDAAAWSALSGGEWITSPSITVLPRFVLRPSICARERLDRRPLRRKEQRGIGDSPVDQFGEA